MNLQNFVLTTDANYIKRFISGTVTITLPAYGTSATVSESHDLGYIPKNYEISSDNADDGIYWSGGEKVEPLTDLETLTGGSADTTYPIFESYVTSAEIYITVLNKTSPTATGTINVDYVVYT